MADDTLARILAALEMAVMEREEDGRFRIHGRPPDWFSHLYPEVVWGWYRFRLTERLHLPFPFQADLERLWEAQEGDVRSRRWFQPDLWEGSQLQARGLVLQGRQFLVLERLDGGGREGDPGEESWEEEMALRLAWATEFGERGSDTHIRRVGLFSSTLAEAWGWERPLVERIRVAAPLHDIGKIAVPLRILSKRGPLTREEFRLTTRHTQVGAKILEGTRAPVLKMAREIALCHHERWDGSGYPHGLRGSQIPESARLVALADVYDALVSERSYRPALPEGKALDLMSSGRGRQFDPAMFDCFLEVLPRLRTIRRQVTH